MCQTPVGVRLQGPLCVKLRQLDFTFESINIGKGEGIAYNAGSWKSSQVFELVFEER